MTPDRWDWDPGQGPSQLVAALGESGIAWIRAPELVEAAEREPWTAAERLLGERPWLVERQPIRAVPGGRSFASGRMAAPFHSDSQLFLGVPPHVQVMACRAAVPGGENLYLDTWALLDRLHDENPPLLDRLFTRTRRFPFVFGDVVGPTVSRRGDSLVFTHSPRPVPDDDVAGALTPCLEAARTHELRAEAGDLLVIHNHRLLHGRRAFDDERRFFTRLLVWRKRPWPAPARWWERAAPIATGDPASPEAARRLVVVLELLRGVPAGVLSAREGIPEPELYRWRDAALSAAMRDLSTNEETT